MPTEPQCPERESNPQTLGFRPSRSAVLAYLGQSGPGRTRTVDRHLVGVLPSPLGYRTVFVSVESPGVAPGSPACGAGVFLLDHDPNVFYAAEAVGLEPTNGISAAACFPSRFLNHSDGFRYHVAKAEAVGLEPTSGSAPPPVFRTGSSSGRMASIVKLRRLESNRAPPRSGGPKTFRASHPTVR